MKTFSGNILFLDRSDINTDEIIPAKYLTEISRQALKPYLLEDLKLEGFNPATDLAGKQVIVTRANFGCGSSREHAPWALEANGIDLVIASGFARIFRQNMFNCGMLAVELAPEQIEAIFSAFCPGPAQAVADPQTGRLVVSDGEKSLEFSFELGEFERALVQAGGWVEYADKRY